jgi:hypothetical protein
VTFRTFVRRRTRLLQGTCALTLGAAFAAACGSPNHELSAIPGLQPAELIHSTNYSGFAGPVRQVVRSRADWESVWARITTTEGPKGVAPPVDFTRDMLLVASPGPGSPGGPNLYAEGYTYRADTMHLYVRIIPRCVVGALPIQLAVVSRVPRHDGVVRIVDRVEWQRC